MIIYNVKGRRVDEYDEKMVLIRMTRLSEFEGKLLEVLSNGKYNSYKDISNYLYGYFDRCSLECIYVFKKRIKRKTKMNISVIRKYGLRLTDEIYIR